MSARTLSITDGLHRYLLEHTLREPELLLRLRQETQALPMAGMQISPEQGQFMRFFVEALGAKRCLEVGVFTGYSSLSVALALPSDGSIVACDVNEAWTNVARRYWRQAGVEHKIDLRLAPATETLEQLLRDGAADTFDFAFIDADKSNYGVYYEKCLQLLRPGGVIAIDNALWGGKVADAGDTTPDTSAIRVLNNRVCADERVTMSMLTIGDGLLLARKRG